MFADELIAGRLVQPFPTGIVTGGYWLTRLMTRKDTPAMAAFRRWLKGTADD
jgi:LysR family transcriptional regulator of beta-lactamase